MRVLARFAANRAQACLAIALAALALRLTLLLWIPVPVPSVQDEFSYLLGGDTMSRFRVANPPHPMWEHFETFQVIQQPTYASKYPPAQSAALALGRWIGHPWIGVLLTVSGMCAAICWMLQGWLPPGLALLGAWIAVLRIGVSGYWVNSYWGGAMAAIGGALVLGALPRLARNPRPGAAWAFAGGAAVLAISRPFEGALLVITCLIALVWMSRSRLGQAIRVAAVPVLTLSAMTSGLIAFMNLRTTGDPFTLPYSLHERQYTAISPFWFDTPRETPAYRHVELRKLWIDFEGEQLRVARGYPVFTWLFYLRRAVDFYAGGSLLLIAAIAPAAALRRLRIPLLTGAAFLGVLMVEKAMLPHYTAPAAAVIYLLLAAGIAAWWRVRRVGPYAASAILAIWMVQAVYPAARPDGGSYSLPGHGQERLEMMRRLEQAAGDHLVIVRYSPDHNVHREWVFNGADIDRSRVVWARDMGAGKNERLVRYFAGRSAWLLEPDATPPRLSRYGEAIALDRQGNARTKVGIPGGRSVD